MRHNFLQMDKQSNVHTADITRWFDCLLWDICGTDKIGGMTMDKKRKIDAKKIVSLFLSLIMVFSLVGVQTVKVKAATTENADLQFANHNYPYGYVSNYSDMTLSVDLEDNMEVSEYQWQVSDAEDGTYTDIEGANSKDYTFAPNENNKWYRCQAKSDNNTITSKAIILLKQTYSESLSWEGAFEFSWYIGNGKMAYSTDKKSFDAVGLYTKNGINYMLGTGYNPVFDSCLKKKSL